MVPPRPIQLLVTVFIPFIRKKVIRSGDLHSTVGPCRIRLVLYRQWRGDHSAASNLRNPSESMKAKGQVVQIIEKRLTGPKKSCDRIASITRLITNYTLRVLIKNLFLRIFVRYHANMGLAGAETLTSVANL